MILMKPNFELIDEINTLEIYKKIESIGRVCYKSEDKITETSYEDFIRGILKRGHESVIEHVNITGKFICDRGVMAELTRHRICSFSIESTRYCNYSNNDIKFILPSFFTFITEGQYELKLQPKLNNQINYSIYKNKWFVGDIYNYEEIPNKDEYGWLIEILTAEKSYNDLIKIYKWSPQQARSILPNSLKTEIVVTANLREWRHIFKLRLAKTAHPDMQQVMRIAFDKIYNLLPLFFEDIKNELGE
jgi:thymidylate synthase (FAD)